MADQTQTNPIKPNQKATGSSGLLDKREARLGSSLLFITFKRPREVKLFTDHIEIAKDDQVIRLPFNEVTETSFTSNLLYIKHAGKQYVLDFNAQSVANANWYKFEDEVRQWKAVIDAGRSGTNTNAEQIYKQSANSTDAKTKRKHSYLIGVMLLVLLLILILRFV